MCLIYYYTFPCSHREYFAPHLCDAALALDLEAQRAITNHPTTNLDLGYPGYDCPTCQASNGAISTAGNKASTYTESADTESVDTDSADTDSTILPPSVSTVIPTTAVGDSNSRREGIPLPVFGDGLGGLHPEEVDDWVGRQRNLVIEQFGEDITDEMDRIARLNVSLRSTGVAATSHAQQRSEWESDQRRATQACNTAGGSAGSRDGGSANTTGVGQLKNGEEGQQGELSHDEGESPPDEGESPPDERELSHDEGESPPDEGESPPDEGESSPDDSVEKSLKQRTIDRLLGLP